jgi:hypothetical protein
MEDCANDGQSLRTVNLDDSQGKEQLLTIVTEDGEGCMRIVDKGPQVEETQYLNDWLVGDENSEDCAEFPETIPSELISLCNEMKFLEMKLNTQRVQTQDAKLELEKGGEIVMKDNDTRNEKEKIVSEDNTEGSDRVISSQEDDNQMLMKQKCKVVEEEEDEHGVAVKKVVNSFLLRHEVGSQGQQVTVVGDEETKLLRMLLMK